MEDVGAQYVRNFLVAMPHVVIATDISEILTDAEPCHVVVARDLRELRAGHFDIVFTVPSILDDATLDGLRAHACQGGHVVLVNGDSSALAESEGWEVLVQPFRPEDVTAILLARGLLRD